jgi:ribosome-binding factor A
MDRKELKQKRLEATYRETISEAILTKVSDSRLAGEVISITRVKVSDDLAVADVYVTTLIESSKNKVIKALFSAAPFFISILGEKLKMRAIPRIKFYYDSEQEGADEMVALIDKLSATGGRKIAAKENDEK